MTKTLLSALFLSLVTGLPLFAQSDSTGTIEITFTHIRNQKGQIAIGINKIPKNFPRTAEVELQFPKEGMKDGVLTVQVEDFPYGTYAISALDDENSNLEMEMFLGIPKEGWGFSMNPPFKLRAARFDECSFELDQPVKQISIQMRYGVKGK